MMIGRKTGLVAVAVGAVAAVAGCTGPASAPTAAPIPVRVTTPNCTAPQLGSAFRGGELTAGAAAPGANATGPTGEIVASILISAEYRDDPASSDGLCPGHQLEPARFRVTLPTGGSLTVSNTVPDPGKAARGVTRNGGLGTCRGELNTGPDLTQLTIGPTAS